MNRLPQLCMKAFFLIIKSCQHVVFYQSQWRVCCICNAASGIVDFLFGGIQLLGMLLGFCWFLPQPPLPPPVNTIRSQGKSHSSSALLTLMIDQSTSTMEILCIWQLAKEQHCGIQDSAHFLLTA